MKNSVFLWVLLLLAAGPLAAQQWTVTSARSGWVSIKKAPATAPVITWQTPLAKQVTEYTLTATVTVRIQSADALTRVQFIRNGTELNREARGFKRAGGVDYTEVIPLVAGSNEIYVKATNAIGSTTSEPRIITSEPEPALPKAATPSVPGQKRLALVIANADYKISKLKNPINDGRIIKQQLEALGFAVTYRENLPLRGLKETFDSFVTDLGSHNVGLFYYAGHGLTVNGETYLQPIDADPKTETDVEFECYSLRQIYARMADVNAKGANLIFWDACRNNPYRSWRRGAGGPTYAPVQPVVGNMIIYATESGKQAYDGDQENGLFTSELVKHINKTNVDIFELVDLIDQGLEARGFKQAPWYEGRFRGKFIFKAN